MTSFKDELLRQAANAMRKDDSGYQQFAQYRAKIRGLYEDYFLRNSGANHFVQEVNDDFVRQLQKLPISDGKIEQDYKWGYMVTMFHNDRNVSVADTAKVEVMMQDFCRSEALKFIPECVHQDPSPNATEAYLVNPFSPDTAIGRQLIGRLQAEGYTITLKDIEGNELPRLAAHPAILSAKMFFTRDDIKQLHRAAAKGE